LIIPHENVLEGMESYLIQQATKRLIQLDVKIINHSRITLVDEHSLILNEKDSIYFDFMIFTGGIVASTLTAGMDLQKNKKSQLIVDKYLSLPLVHDIFAAGDIAELRDKNGNVIPPTAQSAEQSAEIAALNIIARIENKEMIPSDIRMKGVMIALGGNYAVVSLLGWIHFSGLAGYCIKTIFIRGYRYLIHRQCAKGVKQLIQNKSQCRIGI
jgi:NADH dehydrogenase